MKKILSKEIYGNYIIQSDGRLFRKEHSIVTAKGNIRKYKYKEMKYWLRNGYKRLGLTINSKCKHMVIHRIVALAFIPNPDNKPEVNHIDGNKLNNNISNLEWATRLENAQHAWRTGLYTSKRKNVLV